MSFVCFRRNNRARAYAKQSQQGISLKSRLDAGEGKLDEQAVRAGQTGRVQGLADEHSHHLS